MFRFCHIAGSRRRRTRLSSCSKCSHALASRAQSLNLRQGLNSRAWLFFCTTSWLRLNFKRVKIMTKQSQQQPNGKNTIIALLALVVIAIVAFLGYNIYKDYQRSNCVKQLQDKYVDNLWLQNKIQAECGTK